MHGNPVDGFRFIGPFANGLQALEYIQKHRMEVPNEFWLVPLSRPRSWIDIPVLTDGDTLQFNPCQGKTTLETINLELHLDTNGVVTTDILWEDAEDFIPYAPEEGLTKITQDELVRISFLRDTVHFKRRQLDKAYEIIAKSEQEGFGWITLAVCKNHDEAIKEIKKFRGIRWCMYITIVQVSGIIASMYPTDTILLWK